MPPSSLFKETARRKVARQHSRSFFRLLCLSGIVLFGFGTTGCELALLEEAGLAEAGAGEAAVAGGGEAIVAGRAAIAGDSAAMGRLAAIDGATVSETQLTALARVASSRTVAGLGISNPLVEEVAIIRGGGRVLAYPETYPVARAQDIVVKMPNGSVVAAIRRFGSRVAITNARGQIVGESVATGDGTRFNHFVDGTQRVLRGYSTFDGTTLRHWIMGSDNDPVYIGSEIVRPANGVPPTSITIPISLLGGARRHGNGPQTGAATPKGVTSMSGSPVAAAGYFLRAVQAGDLEEAYNCMAARMDSQVWRGVLGGPVGAVLMQDQPPTELRRFELKNLINMDGIGQRFRITAIVYAETRRRVLLYLGRENGLWTIKDIRDATGTYDSVYKNGRWEHVE